MASFAKQGNLGDCVRAGQTQGKAMSLVGTSAGAALSWLIGPAPLHVIACMLPLAALSLYATYRSSRIIVLRSLNLQRTERLYAMLLPLIEGHQTDPAAAQPAAPTPEAIAEVETFGTPYVTCLPGNMHLQPVFSTTDAPQRFSPLRLRLLRGAADLDAAFALLQPTASTSGRATPWRAYRHDSYALAVRRSSGGPSSSGLHIAVWYMVGAQSHDKLRAVWHACALRCYLHGREQASEADARALSARALAAWPSVRESLVAAGWDLSTVYLDGAGGFIEELDDAQ
jgi:hypothetical protein